MRVKEGKEELIDLIKKMLTKNPWKRLGGGLNGSKYDINHLKKHPFFEKLQFDKIQNRIPQVQKLKKGYDMIKFWKRYDRLEFSEYNRESTQCNENSTIEGVFNNSDSDSD